MDLQLNMIQTVHVVRRIIKWTALRLLVKHNTQQWARLFLEVGLHTADCCCLLSILVHGAGRHGVQLREGSYQDRWRVYFW